MLKKYGNIFGGSLMNLSIICVINLFDNINKLELR